LGIKQEKITPILDEVWGVLELLLVGTNSGPKVWNFLGGKLFGLLGGLLSLAKFPGGPSLGFGRNGS